MSITIPTLAAPADNMEAALAYARRDLAIFPAHWIAENGRCSCGKADCNSPGKHPLTARGVKDASRDPAQIRRWWERWPRANVGLPTGKVNNLFVIDADLNKDGIRNLNHLQLAYGFLIPAWEAKTGGGGKHLFFKIPAGIELGNSASRYAPGVDTRGNGGYVIAAPSNHISGGRYEWVPGKGPSDGCELTELPEGWLELISSPAEVEEKPPFQLPDVIGEGQRNDTIYKLGASLRAKRYPMRRIIERLHEVNLERCTPPLDDDEVNKIADSVELLPPGAEIHTSTAEEDFAQEAFTGHALLTYFPRDFSDASMADKIRDYSRGLILRTLGGGCFRWDGTRFAPDPYGEITVASAYTEQLYREAAQQYVAVRDKLTQLEVSTRGTESADAGKAALDKSKGDTDAAKKRLEFALKARQYPRLKAYAELLKPMIMVPGELLDANPVALNTPDGIINLRDGSIRPHSPAERCTAITAVSPSDRGAEIWEAHLDMITCGDADLKRAHQYMAGMFLVGGVYEENLIVAIGAGRNGKSTHYNAMAAALGPDYAGTINPEVLTTDKKNAGADLAALKGKRMIIAGELEEGKRLSSSVLKRLTSTDPISAEKKYCAPESFKPTHSTILYTNFMPRLGSIDDGTIRRLKVVPFNAVIPSGGEIKNYTQRLVDAAGGAILAWMIRGAEMFIRNGYTLPSCRAMEEATAGYIKDNDWMSAFLDECCDIGPGKTCFGGVLHSAYMDRARLENEYPRRGNEFAAELRKRGFVSRRTRNSVTWEGLAVRGDWRMQRGYGPDFSL